MTKKRINIFIMISCVSLMFLLIGNITGQMKARKNLFKELKIFERSLKLVEDHYVRKTDLDDLMSGAFMGLVGNLDPFSSYIDPGRMKQLDDKTKKFETGLTLIKPSMFHFQVVSLRFESPAWHSSLELGNWIQTVAGIPASNLSLYEAETILKGEDSAAVEVGFVNKEGDLDNISIGRELFNRHVRAEILSGGILHIRVLDLKEGSSSEVERALSVNSGKNVDSIILDIRGNAGGSFQEAIDVADLFLSKGLIVTVERRGEDVVSFQARKEKTSWDGELILMTDLGTMGEAEILAAAIKENSRGRLVGERTIGKGYAQELIHLADGSGLVLSVKKYVGPEGIDIHKKGIEPDIKIRLDSKEPPDNQLEKALEIISEELKEAA